MELRLGCPCPIRPICCTKIGSLQSSLVKGSTEGSSWSGCSSKWAQLPVLLWKYCGSEFVKAATQQTNYIVSNILGAHWFWNSNQNSPHSLKKEGSGKEIMKYPFVQ